MKRIMSFLLSAVMLFTMAAMPATLTTAEAKTKTKKTTAKKTAKKPVKKAAKKAKTTKKTAKSATSKKAAGKKATKTKQATAKAKTKRRLVSSRHMSFSRHGEMMDWKSKASKAFPIGSIAYVTDVRSGKIFQLKRTFGTNHADCEALTSNDTSLIKSIWGSFTWDVRPVVVHINGKDIAASMSAMPHAGVDSAPALANVKNRSEGYGFGTNLDVVKHNGMNGHIDIHFLNSTRHKDGRVDQRHQEAIRVAAR